MDALLRIKSKFHHAKHVLQCFELSHWPRTTMYILNNAYDINFVIYKIDIYFYISYIK